MFLPILFGDRTLMFSTVGLQKKCHRNFRDWHVFFCLLINHFMVKSKKSTVKGEKNAESSNNPKRKANGKTANEIVKRHLSDKEDEITKKDFENLKIDLSLPKDKAHEPLPIKDNKERPKDADKDKTIITPWDVISE